MLNTNTITDAGIPIPMRLRVVDKLVTELHLDSQWFYALSYITDPEYFLMVINQIKYLVWNVWNVTVNSLIKRTFMISIK